MKKHINVILCLIIYCVIFCFSDVYAASFSINDMGVVPQTDNVSSGAWYQSAWNGSFYNANIPTNVSYNNLAIHIGQKQLQKGSYYFIMGLTFKVGNNNSQYSTSYSVALTQGVDDTGVICKINDTNNENPTGLKSYYIVECISEGTQNFNNLRIYNGNITSVSLYTYYIKTDNITDVITEMATVNNAINTQTQIQQQQNQIINNTDSSGNATDFNNVVNNATLPNTSHGFDILGSLQNFIGNIEVSGSCNRISVPIPFTNQTLILPCMTTDVYSVHFPEIVVIWQLLARGLGYYYILVNILKLIKETIDPFNFKLEVMDL